MDLEMTAEQMGKILTKLLEDGFETPIILTGIGANGSIMVGEYTPDPDGAGGLRCEMLAERTKGGTFTMPLNMLFVDATGKAARVVIDRSGKPKFLH